jgi:hypothetical protein
VILDKAILWRMTCMGVIINLEGLEYVRLLRELEWALMPHDINAGLRYMNIRNGLEEQSYSSLIRT